MKDFFISYTAKDEEWAVWVAWQLEQEGYSTVIQAWDFRPGANFVVAMQNALKETERTVAVLSKDYLQSAFGTPEWAAVFAQDPMGLQHKLLPVKIQDCSPEGLLKPLVWVNLIGLSEAEAKQKLIEGVQTGRAKPLHPPIFPGERSVQEKPVYPQGSYTMGTYIPNIKREKTDLEISDFIEKSFQTIREYFTNASSELMKHHSDIRIKLTTPSDIKFMCEAFHNGTSKAKCKIWIDYPSYSNPQIGYNDSSFSFDQDNSFNEILSISDSPYDFGLQSLMRVGWESHFEHMDFTNLTSQQAVEYLWRRFVSALER